MVTHHNTNKSTRSQLFKFQLTIAVFCILLTGVFTFAGKQNSREMITTQAETGTTKIIVKLDVPNIAELTAISTSHKGIKPGEPFDSEGYQADMDLKNAIDNVADDVLEQLKGTTYKINHRFVTIPYMALDVSAEALTALTKAKGVMVVKEDRAWVPVEPARASDEKVALRFSSTDSQNNLSSVKLDDTIPLIGADVAWNMGFDGTGWYVAIVDTGLRTSHEMFNGKNIDEHCFSVEGDCPNGQTEMHGTGAAYHPIPGVNCDIFGHGTRVTGIAAGSNGNGPSGLINGVAPGADIIAVRVVSIDEANNCISDYESDTGRALEHIYTLRNNFPIASVNVSLGYDLETDPCADIFDGGIYDAVANLKNVNIATVTAVGNNNQCGSVTFPACIADAVAVGASTDSDTEWSNSNWDSQMLNFFAPGHQIITSKGTGDTAYVNANDPNDLWSGTSLAAPHVTGAWAILRQAAPNATWQEIYDALANTGVAITTSCTGGGSKPRIQVDDALVSLQQITVTAPTTWTYTPGSDIAFNWTSQGLTGDVMISVVTPQYSLLVENAYPISAGTYLWEVPANIALGACSVSIGQGSVYDYSQTFYIGTIDVTYPVGGETYGRGNTVPITWTSEGIVGSVRVVAQSNYTSYILDNDYPYNGSPYNWVIPSTFPTGQCRILVFQGGAMAYSGYFNIGTIEVTQPLGGQTFSHGQNMNIGWNTDGITGDVMLVLQTYIDPLDPNPPLGISYIINQTVPYNGSPYTWTIPTHITPGQYTVMVRQGNIEGRSGVITVTSAFESNERD